MRARVSSQPLSSARWTWRQSLASSDQILLAEILALRTLVLHIQLALLQGEALTPESIRRLMARVDDDKLQHARDRLALTPIRRRR